MSTVNKTADEAQTTGPIEPLLTAEEVARWVRVSQATLCRWRQTGKGPRVAWLSPTCPRYRRADVEAWLKKVAT